MSLPTSCLRRRRISGRSFPGDRNTRILQRPCRSGRHVQQERILLEIAKGNSRSIRRNKVALQRPGQRSSGEQRQSRQLSTIGDRVFVGLVSLSVRPAHRCDQRGNSLLQASKALFRGRQMQQLAGMSPLFLPLNSYSVPS